MGWERCCGALKRVCARRLVMHLSDGTLRRSLDEPVAIDARSRAHLGTCDRCRRRLAGVTANAASVGAMFASPVPAVDVDAARLRLGAAEAAAAATTPAER